MNELFFSYIEGRSVLHRLDPRTKLVSVMLLSVVVLGASSSQDMVLLSSAFFLFALLAKQGIKHHLNSLRPMLLFFISLPMSVSRRGKIRKACSVNVCSRKIERL